jgi:hypothetical protein
MQMDHYSQSLDEDKMARVKADMDDVKNVMVDNIEKARARPLRPCAAPAMPRRRARVDAQPHGAESH